MASPRAQTVEQYLSSLHLLGALFLAGMVIMVVQETPLFLNPRYRNLWEDITAYHLGAEGRKSHEELVELYGAETVARYIDKPGLLAAYLPSEEAALANAIGYIISRQAPGAGVVPGGVTIPLFVALLLALPLFYVPAVAVARGCQRYLSARLCQSPKASALREAYFERVHEKQSYWAVAGAFAFALATSVINAFDSITPAMRARGITVLDLTGVLVFLGYFSGLLMRLVAYLVDVLFLAAGKDPHRSIWDEVIALAITAPVLLLVYNSSLMTVVTGAVTGLAGGLLAKRRHRPRLTLVS